MQEAPPHELCGENEQVGFDIKELFDVVQKATVEAKNKLLKLRENSDKISIGDMFEMQMLMNRLSQLSEMSTSIVSSAHQAVSMMARNVKG